MIRMNNFEKIKNMSLEYLKLCVKENAHRDLREALEWITRNQKQFF